VRAIRHYLLLVGLPLIGVVAALRFGEGTIAPAAGGAPPPGAASEPHALLVLILQIGVILLASRGVGLVFRRIGQPQVMGEMAAGILLGPSLLGWLAPELSAALFPPGSLALLGALSQVGILLFMFLVGLELDDEVLRRRGEAAVLTSHVSIVVPTFLGVALALFLYPRLSDSGVTFHAFALFMGAAMSVTAFPVLARILTERNLQRTRLGSIAIACAAVDDVSAWCILAAVIALVRVESAEAQLATTLLGTAGYVGAMLLLVRPALRRLEVYYHHLGRLTDDMLAIALLALLASTWATERLGIHALFGAFLLGAIMPKDSGLVRELTEKLGNVTVVLLLPLFFAATGLRTQVGLLHGLELWLLFGLVVAVAVAGKFGGSALAARVAGLSWREAGALGALMNARGLIQLVFLTIGLELGILSPTLFTMMVLMALVTTFMTSPLLEWIYPTQLIRREALGAEEERKEFTMLIPVALPSAGPELLRLAAALAPAARARIYALHLVPAWQQSMLESDERPVADEMLRPTLVAAEGLGIQVRPLTFVSRDVGEDIAEVALARRADLVLMGWHKPVLRESVLSGAIQTAMSRARTDVAVYIPRHFHGFRRVLVPYVGNEHDRAALALARRLGEHGGAEITILHLPRRGGARPPDGTVAETIDATGTRLRVLETDEPLDEIVAEARRGYDLVVVGASEAFGLQPSLFGIRHERLARECPASLLIVHQPPDVAAAGRAAAESR
jgi:Kef-type K+ transport system membrane component KefB